MRTDEQRELVDNIARKVENWPVEKLQALKDALNSECAKGGPYSFGDYMAQFAVLTYISNRIASLTRNAQAEAEQFDSPEERFRKDSERVAKLTGVSVEQAQKFIQRKGSPFDVMRKQIQPAPAPEPASRLPDAVAERQRQHDRYAANVLKNTS